MRSESNHATNSLAKGQQVLLKINLVVQVWPWSKDLLVEVIVGKGIFVGDDLQTIQSLTITTFGRRIMTGQSDESLKQ